MNKFLKIPATLLAIFTAASSFAVDPWPVYATGGTAVGTTISYGVISAHSVNGGAPLVTYINASSDKAGSVIQFYRAGSPVNITAANSTVTVPAVTNVAGFVANAVVILRHLSTDTYERRIISSVTTTNVVLTVAPTVATAAGDQFYVATTSGSIPWGATTNSVNGTGIYSGQPGKPLLVEVDSTTVGSLNAVSASYVK